MQHEFASEQDLFERLTTNPGEVVYLIGSAVTAPARPGEPGVPGVEGVIDMIRQIYTRPEQRARFEDRLREGEENRYQAAFKHLLRTRDQDTVNQIIRRCVLQTWSRPLPTGQQPTPELCRRLEDDLEGWHLPAGVRALGRILAAAPPGARPVVLTSNFDPLLAISVRRHGGSVLTAALQSDGSFAGIDGHGCRVVHFHGDWFRSDTLHTPTQLGRERPKLGAALAHLIGDRTLVVLGYGGWDDIFTNSLAAVIAGEQAPIKVAWTFYGEDEQQLRRQHARLLTRLDHGTGRVVLYKGIDVHTFLPRLADELAGEIAARLPETSASRLIVESSIGLSDAPIELLAQPPGASYDPRWYIARGGEARAIGDLVHHGGVLVSSAPMGGKSTFIHAVIAELRAQLPGRICVVDVGLGELSEEALGDPALCFRELTGIAAGKYALELREQFDEPADDVAQWLAARWRHAQKHQERNLSRVFGELLRELLRRARASGRTIVLVIDRLERLTSRTVGLQVARVLRASRETSNQHGDPLSLLLAASGTNLHFTGVDAVSELANVCDTIHLTGFTVADLARLAALYRRPWSPAELAQLHTLLGGHPYLTRFVMFLEAKGTPRAELFDDARRNFRWLGAKLKELWLTVEAQPELKRAIHDLLLAGGDRPPLSREQEDRLRVSGFLDDDARELRIAGALIAEYFRERC